MGGAGGEEGTQRRRTLPRLQRIPEMLPHRQHLRIGADVVEMGAVTGERRRAKVGGNVKSTGPTPDPIASLPIAPFESVGLAHLWLIAG